MVIESGWAMCLLLVTDIPFSNLSSGEDIHSVVHFILLCLLKISLVFLCAVHQCTHQGIVSSMCHWAFPHQDGVLMWEEQGCRFKLIDSFCLDALKRNKWAGFRNIKSWKYKYLCENEAKTRLNDRLKYLYFVASYIWCPSRCLSGERRPRRWGGTRLARF